MTARVAASLTLIAVGGCSDGDLHGRTTTSEDGGTYLTVEPSGYCSQLTVDDKEWPHRAGVAGEVSPGTHLVRCHQYKIIEFEIEVGEGYHVEYWGP